jgi:hypothetical protein
VSEHLARIQLVHLEVGRLSSEGQVAARNGDLERLQAINAELDVLLESAREIRREQLREEIEWDQPKPKRRWWRFWRPAASHGRQRDA